MAIRHMETSTHKQKLKTIIPGDRHRPAAHISFPRQSDVDAPTFEDEIRETPAALRSLLDYWQSQGRSMAAESVKAVGPLSKVIFTGMGSSINAAYSAKYLLARSGIAASIEPASELYYDLLKTILPDTLLVASSQSGETIETKKVVAASEGHERLWVTANDGNSAMATCGRPFFHISAGLETRSASKTYTNTIVLFYLLAEQLCGGQPLPDSRWDEVIDAVALTLDRSENIVSQMLSHWGPLDRLQVVSRGPSQASAQEFSLLMAENNRVFVQAVDGGAFRHGFNGLAGEDHKVLLLVTDSATAELSRDIAAQVASRGSRVVVLTSVKTNSSSIDFNDDGRLLKIPLTPVPCDLSPLLEILPLEILALRLAEKEGRDPGKLESKVQIQE